MSSTLPVVVSAAPRAGRRWPRALAAQAARLLAPLGYAFGSIFFIPHPWIGLVLALALLTRPEYALFALEGFAVGAVVNRLLGSRDEPGAGGGATTDAVLAAVVMGWLTGAIGVPWAVRVLLAAVAGLPAALLARALLHFLDRSAMPVVLLGYCIAAAMMFSICPQCTAAAANAMPPWPQLVDARGWGESLLRSLGALMYGQDWVAGAFVAVGVLAWSRAMFACGIAGWIGGALAALAFQRLHLVYYWLPLSYNFFLAGGVLGAVLFLPGRASLAVAAAAGALASLFGLAFQYALDGSSTSYLPLSGALAIWAGLGALSGVAVRAPREASPGEPPENPERAWWRQAYSRARFGPAVPLFAVPAAGELLVTQGFAGALSHDGALRHALDFERPRADGAALGAVHGAEVLSPVAGTVERVRNHVADNPPGVCNYAERWGNHVVIRLDGQQGWALLAHLQQGSAAVYPGMRVEVGSYLGRVGNSGRSTFAHLHVQLQAGAEPGFPTLPFKLANYLQAVPPDARVRPWIASGVPREGEVVQAAPRHPAVFHALASVAPGTGVWIVECSGDVPHGFRPAGGARTQRLDVAIDGVGRHVFTDAGGASLVACLDPDAWRIVSVDAAASPLLKLLALAVPTIPYAARPGSAWSDLPPLPPQGVLRAPVALALAPYLRQPFVRVASMCVAGPVADTLSFEVHSRIETPAPQLPRQVGCTLAPLRGPVRIRAEFARGALTCSVLSYEAGGEHTGGRGDPPRRDPFINVTQEGSHVPLE